MEIFVNNISIAVFEGAKAIDAIISYYRMLHYPVPEQFPLILDNYGNVIEPDGELVSQNRIYIKDTFNTQPYD